MQRSYVDWALVLDTATLQYTCSFGGHFLKVNKMIIDVFINCQPLKQSP